MHSVLLFALRPLADSLCSRHYVREVPNSPLAQSLKKHNLRSTEHRDGVQLQAHDFTRASEAVGNWI